VPLWGMIRGGRGVIKREIEWGGLRGGASEKGSLVGDLDINARQLQPDPVSLGWTRGKLRRSLGSLSSLELRP
jgi:hypothetical protein